MNKLKTREPSKRRKKVPTSKDIVDLKNRQAANLPIFTILRDVKRGKTVATADDRNVI